MSNTVSVNRETIVKSSIIRDGNRVYQVERSNRGGVTITLGKTSLYVSDSVATSLFDEVGAVLSVNKGSGEVKARRKRRTKAEMQAAREAEAALNAAVDAALAESN